MSDEIISERERLEFTVKLVRDNKLERLTVTEWGIDIINNPVLQAQLEAASKTQKELTAEEKKRIEEEDLYYSSR